MISKESCEAKEKNNIGSTHTVTKILLEYYIDAFMMILIFYSLKFRIVNILKFRIV